MPGYRFCRTDDIDLLVDALNRCWLPYCPGEPPVTAAAFKRSIRDLQVWCSSCMVAFSDSEPIGVLIGAKRSSSTLVHRLAVHPDHLRRGHGRHLLTSLGSKLAILGPQRIVAEIPGDCAAGRATFGACGFVEEAILTDYTVAVVPGLASCEATGTYVVPISVDDLSANGLLGDLSGDVCWQRSVETLQARKDEIAGLAAVSDDRIEACILYIRCTATPQAELVFVRAFAQAGDSHLPALVRRLSTLGLETLRLARVHPGEIRQNCLETLGLRAEATHRRLAATARPH